MKIQLADVMFNVRSGVLGVTDNKMMVVTQGCSHVKCKGCMSPHTWDAKAGKEWTVDTLIQLAESKCEVDPPTGLVISGGEPLDQLEQVVALVTAFRQRFSDAEVVLFTAYRQSYLLKHYQQLLALLDVVVAGPYVATLSGYSLLGSSNQEVMLLSDRAKDNYQDWQTWQCQSQAFVKNGEVTIVGLQDTRKVDFSATNRGYAHNSDVFFRQRAVEEALE